MSDNFIGDCPHWSNIHNTGHQNIKFILQDDDNHDSRCFLIDNHSKESSLLLTKKFSQAISFNLLQIDGLTNESVNNGCTNALSSSRYIKNSRRLVSIYIAYNIKVLMGNKKHYLLHSENLAIFSTKSIQVVIKERFFPQAVGFSS